MTKITTSRIVCDVCGYTVPVELYDKNIWEQYGNHHRCPACQGPPTVWQKKETNVWKPGNLKDNEWVT